MKRYGLAILGLFLVLTPVRAQSAEEKKATIAWVQSMRQPDGSYWNAPTPNILVPPSLRSTSAALRALKYWGGEAKELPTTAKFIRSCYDKASGGFADAPGGKPDVFVTAVGIMAAGEAKVPADLYSDGAIKYLTENAKSFDDIRIAVAGLERLGKPSPRIDAWRKHVAGLLNAEGTAGKGDGAARETGSVVVALLRLGGKVENTAAVLKVLNSGQRADGGYGKADAKGSDLETTYRVMRAFHMFKKNPEGAAKLRAFVAKCRNADGGYGMAPEQASTVGATYFASIILHWLDEK